MIEVLIKLNILEVDMLLYVLSTREQLGPNAETARKKLLKARNELNRQWVLFKDEEKVEIACK